METGAECQNFCPVSKIKHLHKKDMENSIFVQEIREELLNGIIPFWENLKDDVYGGFYGYLGYDLKLNEEAEKGCILNSRICWFFSNAYMLLRDEELLGFARHAFLFLKEHCIDMENGGIYWSVNYKGEPLDTTKHTYNQAFGIYALSAYYEASHDEEALRMAEDIYSLIEEKCRDEYGYLEAFNLKFEPMENEKLSENGVNAEKTMNTLLHLFEGYTGLYHASHKEEVARRLKYMLSLIRKKVFNEGKGRLEVFFDKKWDSLVDLNSFGHDIEASWLVDRGVEVLDDETLMESISPMLKAIRENIYEKAYKQHSLLNESENGIVNTTRIWWVQAEAVVGFLNAWERDPEKEYYLDAAKDIWNYIKNYMIDKRTGSEWFWAVDEDRQALEKPIVEPWKCPYHNGRMCMEVIKRLGNNS